MSLYFCFFFFQAEDGIRDYKVTGVQTCALPILMFGFMGLVPGAGTSTGTGAGSNLWSGVQAALQPAIFNARSSAGEEVLITYTRGQGQFSDDKRFIALTNPIYNLDGTQNGLHEGVWQATFKSPAELLARPAPPAG